MILSINVNNNLAYTHDNYEWFRYNFLEGLQKWVHGLQLGIPEIFGYR